MKKKWIELSSSAATVIDVGVATQIAAWEAIVERCEAAGIPRDDEEYRETLTWLGTARLTHTAIRNGLALGILIEV